MRIVDLTGMWMLRRGDDPNFREMQFMVPGGVHPALMEAGLISDPGVDANAAGLGWVADCEWIFERPFHLEPGLAQSAVCELEFDGIDAFASVFLNGEKVLDADNMFKSWRANVRGILRDGENTIRVNTRRPDASKGETVRKARYVFGSEYSPQCVTVGICRPVRLVFWDTARFRDFGFSQRHSNGAAELFFGGWADSVSGKYGGLSVCVSVFDPEGAEAASVSTPLSDGARGAFGLQAEIRDPQLWWPNGMGEQPLYTVSAALMDGSGCVCDRFSARVGLRTLRVVPEEERGGRGCLECNGRKVFVRGGVWIPPGLFPSRVSGEDYAFLVGSAADANLNVFRLWDGGTFENSAFWDLCDERGIVVEGLADISDEADLDGSGPDNGGIFRHACIPDSLMENMCAGPEAPEVMRTPVSFPAPDTMMECVPEGKRNITCPDMERRVAGGSSTAMISQIASRWPLPMSFSDWIVLSQISHAVEVCGRIERERFEGGSGVLWEPYASCWAMADGSSIDSAGRWKALHYMARRACAPVCVRAVDNGGGSVDVAVSNMGRADSPLRLVWRVSTPGGTVLDTGEKVFVPECGAVVHPASLSLSAMLSQYSPGGVILWMNVFDGDGFLAAGNHLLFAPPKQLLLENPGITADIDDTMNVDGEDAFKVTLSCTSASMWTWLSLRGADASYSDNFICMEPDETYEIYVAPIDRMTQYTFRKRLEVRSLWNISAGGG